MIFVGCSLDDADLLEQISNQHKLFGESTGPHYVLVRDCDELSIKEKLKGLPIDLVTFSDFGQPLINLLGEISQQSSNTNRPQIQTLTANPVERDTRTSKRNIRIAILVATPIDKNYNHDDLLHEFKKLKADVTLLHLSVSTLNGLEDFDYIFILTKVLKTKVVIEDEMLATHWISLKDLEDNIGNRNTKGVFVFLDYKKETDLDPLDLKLLAQPTLISPALNKSQISSFIFQIFKKKAFHYVEESICCNLERFEIDVLNGSQKLTIIKTNLPANIDPRTTKNYVGRRTDLENICRKIIELRDSSEILTIKGSGGIGKTITLKRLAVELAGRNYFSDGIDFIDCEFIADSKAFEDNIARCFNLENALNLQDQIGKRFRNQDRLIVLDNVETLLHLASSGPIKEFMSFISEYATIVVTSRELIDLDCEQSYELRPFTTDEAYELFVLELPWRDKISEEDKHIIRHDILESLLDNNPLAIRLITKNIPNGKRFQDLKTELEMNFFQKVSQSELDVFDSASDANIERKKSLYGSINFSYQYLSDKEKVAFELLSLFPDGINLESFKKISQEGKTHRNGTSKKTPVSEALLITDPIIKSLESKSLIQVDNNKIKHQSIIGKFAEHKFRQRSEDELERYHRNAFSYNHSFAKGLASNSLEIPLLVLKIFNGHQNNFIKSIQYLSSIKYDHEVFFDYIDDLHNLFIDIAASKRLKQELEKYNFAFDDKNEQLCFDITMLSLDYFNGNFSSAYRRLKDIMPLARLSDFGSDILIERNLHRQASNLYMFEGEVLCAIKSDISRKMFTSHYPPEFLQLGYFNKQLLSASRIDFMTLDAMLSSGLLTQEIINTYIKQGIFEKSHLEMTQVHYLKAKLGVLKKQSINELVAVNPYTEGLKQLMFAFVEKNLEAKDAYFTQALQNLTHIKYYYVEALYFYAQFLKEIQSGEKFDEIFQLGIGLARKHHYRFKLYKFEELVAKTSHEYDMDNYPLPEYIDLDGYANFLLKEHRRR